MNDNQRAHLNMDGKLNIWLANKATAIGAINPRVAALKILLSNKIADINANDLLATVDNTGIAEGKGIERDELTTSIRLAISYLIIYCKSTTPPNTVLLRQIDFTKTALAVMPDNDLLNTTKFISGKVSTAPVAAAVLALGYVAGDLTDFNTNIGQFAAMINTPREAIGETSAYTAEVAKNFDEIRIIEDKIEAEMAIFEFRDNLLFTQYKNVTIIDDAATSTNTYSGSLGGNENIRITGFTYSPTTQVMLKATGERAVEYSLKNSDGSDVVGSAPITIAAGNAEPHNLSDLAPSGDTIWVRNTDATTITTYSITFL